MLRGQYPLMLWWIKHLDRICPIAMRNILISDTHEVLRRGAREVIESRPGLQVVAEATSGDQALAAARSTRPDIAIVGLLLNNADDIDVARAFKHELPKTQVLIYSMDAGD